MKSFEKFDKIMHYLDFVCVLLAEIKSSIYDIYMNLFTHNDEGNYQKIKDKLWRNFDKSNLQLYEWLTI